MKVIFDLSLLMKANHHIVKRFAEVPDPLLFPKKILESIDATVFSIENFFRKRCKEIILCTDGSYDTFRKGLYSEYKGTRSNDDNYRECKRAAEETCSKVEEYNLVGYRGLEADDLVYLASREGFSVIVSGDKDLYQCVNFHQRIGFEGWLEEANLRDKHLCVYWDFRQKQMLFDIDPLAEKFEKVLMGCKGDNVPKSIIGRRSMERFEAAVTLLRGRKFSVKNILLACKKTGIEVNKEHLELNYDLTVFDINIYNKYLHNFVNPFSCVV